MKTYSLLVQVSAGMVAAFLYCGASNGLAASASPVQIAVAPVGQASLFENVRWEAGKMEKLRHAYYLLEHADGDYAGHREAAMKSIKRAANVLGFDVKGGGHAEESQWTSDHKLHEAKHLLEELQDETGGKEQEHVHRAVKELDRALAHR